MGENNNKRKFLAISADTQSEFIQFLSIMVVGLQCRTESNN